LVNDWSTATLVHFFSARKHISDIIETWKKLDLVKGGQSFGIFLSFFSLTLLSNMSSQKISLVHITQSNLLKKNFNSHIIFRTFFTMAEIILPLFFIICKVYISMLVCQRPKKKETFILFRFMLVRFSFHLSCVSTLSRLLSFFNLWDFNFRYCRHW